MTFETLVQAASVQSDTVAVLESRRSVGAAWLGAPGPDALALETLLTIAARVPDHGALVPWRFIAVEGDARAQLVQRLQAACIAAVGGSGNAGAQAAKTVEKIGRLFGCPPLVVIVVSRPDPHAKIPVFEQVLSAGAVCMNLMTAAAGMGFASNWLTGWTATDPAARPVLGLQDGETVAGIIPIGTPSETPPDRPRPDLSQVVTQWGK